MLKVRNGAVRLLRFVLIGLVLVLLALFSLIAWLCSLPVAACDRLHLWLDTSLPKPKLSAAQKAEWDAYEKERRDRLTMTLAEFDAKYPPGEQLNWTPDAIDQPTVVQGPWSVGDDSSNNKQEA